jgi:hypothetical protein
MRQGRWDSHSAVLWLHGVSVQPNMSAEIECVPDQYCLAR